MSAAALAQTWSLPAAGGLGGVRLAAALAVSVGVHAGAALWLGHVAPASGGAVHPRSVEVRLVSAPRHARLAPTRPGERLAAVSPHVLATDVARVPRLAGMPAVTPIPARAVPAAAVPVRARTASAAAISVRARAAPAPLAAASRRVVEPREPRPSPAPRRVSAPDREPSDAAPASPPSAPAPSVPARAGDAGGSAAQPAAAPVHERTPPRPVADNPVPAYPLVARRHGQQGRVLLRVQVDADGTASVPDVVVSSGVASLDRAARDAVARWRFAPARDAGRAVSATVEVPVVFRLDGRG